MEWLEERQLLTWVATFVNSTGALTIQGQGLSSDTGVLKVDPNTDDILLDGNNSGNFVDTGANLATINTTIQIQANTTINSNFIIDNNAGAFFEAPATFPTNTPLFNFTGSTVLNPNSSLTIRGQHGIDDTLTVTPDTFTQNKGVAVLTQPPNELLQQNSLTVDYTGVTGHLSFDGIDGFSGKDKLVLIDPFASVSHWVLNGNTIDGPQAAPAPTVPPTPPPPPGNIGDITYSNVDNLQFNNTFGLDTLVINSLATNTTASDAGTTVVNYNQPLAYPLDLFGVSTTTTTQTPSGTLDIVGAKNGNNDFYVTADSVSLAAPGVHPQYNTPFAHVGADLTYTADSLFALQIAGNGGNNTFTIQVPPVFSPLYATLQTALPGTVEVYGGPLPPALLLPGVVPPVVTVGTDLLRVFGNAPGPTTTGDDSIGLYDAIGAGNNVSTQNNFIMSDITAAVIYGEGGNDNLSNLSFGNAAQGISPVPALLIGGSGNDTMTGGAGNDMFLGGGGEDTILSTAASTPQAPTTTYFFPHQDQFGNIYDPLLGNSGFTTSTITGTGGNQVVVTGAVGAGTSAANAGDTDLGNLALGGAGTGGGLGGQTLSYPTVPPGNVTASIYMPTQALTALEQAMGVTQGPFPANKAAVLEFGRSLDTRAQFATYAGFVGRAYNDFMISRGGSGVLGNPVGNQGGSGVIGSSVVSPQEVQYWVSQGQLGLSVQQMQAELLASDELRQFLQEPTQWVRFLYQSVTGQLPSDAVLTADANLLNAGDTAAVRYNLALQLLMSPTGQAAELSDIYNTVVPQGGSPSPTNQAAINADLSAGESLVQIAQTLAASQGNYLNYELNNNVGVVGFVDGLYQSVLHRAASAGDLSYWSAVRGAGATDAQIAQAILNSPEAKAFVIENAYQTYLGRAADAGGMFFWQQAFAAGLTDEQFMASIIGSQEYYARNGSTSPTFVQGLYHDLLGRSPDSQQAIDFWVSQVAMSTQGRPNVALEIQQSSEFQTDLIHRWYQLYDGRAPSGSELSTALSQLQSGATDEFVQAQILAARQGT